jgi:hypothetical protein
MEGLIKHFMSLPRVSFIQVHNVLGRWGGLKVRVRYLITEAIPSANTEVIPILGTKALSGPLHWLKEQALVAGKATSFSHECRSHIRSFQWDRHSASA